jgi:hypothetical protein
MAFELMESSVISICMDCVYFNEFGRLDDQTLINDRHATDKHRSNIAMERWPWGTEFTSGCGRECPEHGIDAYGGDEEAYETARDGDTDVWFSSSGCDQCGSPLGGDREHATAFYYPATGHHDVRG